MSKKIYSSNRRFICHELAYILCCGVGNLDYFLGGRDQVLAYLNLDYIQIDPETGREASSYNDEKVVYRRLYKSNVKTEVLRDALNDFIDRIADREDELIRANFAMSAHNASRYGYSDLQQCGYEEFSRDDDYCCYEVEDTSNDEDEEDYDFENQEDGSYAYC